jgi:pimeloyl-ACP methyl ester carboxylesterase
VPSVAVNGTRLHYERHGGGEPLLLITGFTISSAVFEPILDLYGTRFECIVYDNRGSGRSGAPRLTTSMPELAADAAGLLRAIGVDSAHACGLSMGGMIAQELAIRFPERVRGLVLGGTTPGGPRAARPAVGELGALAGGAAGGRRRSDGAWLGKWLFSEEFRREHPDRVRDLLRNFARHRATPQGIWAHWWASVYHDTMSRLHRIEAPTLVMHGERDAMAPISNARLLAERIPDAELAIVPGSGHAYLLERPEASFALMCEWMDRRSPIPAGTPRSGVAARAEPLTRALGLPIGAARTGASLAALMTDKLSKRSADVASDR